MTKPIDCKWLYNHVSITSEGYYRPCCNFENHRSPDANIKTTSIQEWPSSQKFKDIKSDFANGKFPDGCIGCQHHEDKGLKSYRQSGLNKYSEYTNDSFYLRDIEIKFGNLCNIGCYMCSSTNSSFLANEIIQTDNHFMGSNPKILNDNWFEDPAVFDRLVTETKQCYMIRFTGGEPTVRTILRDFLRKIAEHDTDKIIRFHTNGQKMPRDLVEILSVFKKVIISWSIDAIGKPMHYIRYPGSFEKFEQNLSKVKDLTNVVNRLSPTVQIANVNHLADLWQFAYRNSMQVDYNILHKPEHLQPCLAADEIKLEEIKKLKDLQKHDYYQDALEQAIRALQIGNPDCEDLRRKAVAFFESVDASRNLNYREYIKI